MKFLLDSAVPKSLAEFLESEDFSVEQVPSQLHNGQHTDKAIRQWADSDNRVLITQDPDFWMDHLVYGSPMSLLLIRRESLGNPNLVALFQKHLDDVLTCFMQHRVAELSSRSLVVLR